MAGVKWITTEGVHFPIIYLSLKKRICFDY